MLKWFLAIVTSAFFATALSQSAAATPLPDPTAIKTASEKVLDVESARYYRYYGHRHYYRPYYRSYPRYYGYYQPRYYYYSRPYYRPYYYYW